MSEEVWCRLCSKTFSDYLSLYDETGHCNAKLYEVAVKYFHPTILTAVNGQLQTVMCLECWRHISEFHNFQNDIILAQEQLRTRGKQIEVMVKVEYPSADATCHFADGVQSQSLDIIVKSENQFVALSDVELMHLDQSITSMTSSNIHALLPNPIGTTDDVELKGGIFNVVQSSQNGENDDTDQSLVREDGTIGGMLTGEDFNNIPEIDSTDNALSSDDEMLPVSNSMVRSEHEICGEASEEQESTGGTQLDPLKNETSRSNDEYIAKWLPTLNCPRCNIGCSNFGLIDQHFKKYHRGERVYVECCKRKFYRRNVLAEHCSVHTDPSRLSCKVCNIFFSSRTALYLHMIRQHPKSSAALNYTPRTDKYIDAIVADWKPNLECVHCNASYTSLTILHGHFKLQHPNEAFHILCCQQRLVLVSEIREHALSHTAHKALKYSPKLGDTNMVKIPYHKCNICHKSFRYFNKLHDHIVTHSGSGYFKCPYCSQIFKSSSGVYGHLKISHPSEKAVPITDINYVKK